MNFLNNMRREMNAPLNKIRSNSNKKLRQKTIEKIKKTHPVTGNNSHEDVEEITKNIIMKSTKNVK